MIAKLKEKTGASIVIALILMIVFLTIGASILTTASASVQNAAAMQHNRELYYYARSVSSTFTQGLTNFENNSFAQSVLQMIAQDTTITDYTCTVSGTNLPAEFVKEPSDDLNMEPIAISIKDIIQMPTGEVVRIGRITATFSVDLEDETYMMYAQYKYEKPGEGTDETGFTLVRYGK